MTRNSNPKMKKRMINFLLKNKKLLFGVALLFVISIGAFIWNNYQIEISERPVKPLKPPAFISGDCGIEQCHGLEITCGPNIQEPCTAIGVPSDICRQYVRCQKVGGKCQLIKDPKFDECKLCVNRCDKESENDPINNVQCYGKCGETSGSSEGAKEAVTNTNVPVHIVVNIDRAPRIGETATITWKVLSDWDFPELNAFLELPGGLQLVGGIASWQGSLPAGGSRQLSAVVKVIKEGVFGIRAVVRTNPDKNGDSWSDVNYLYLTVTATGSKIGLVPLSGDPRRVQVEQPGGNPEGENVAPEPPALNP